MSDQRFIDEEVSALYGDDVRRPVLDAEEERTLQAELPDGSQSVVEPPVGTIGGPATPPGDDVTTTQARTVPTGGGPGDSRRMQNSGEQPTQTTGRSEESGTSASPDVV